MQWVERHTDSDLMETIGSTGHFDLFSRPRARRAGAPALETGFKHSTHTPELASNESSSSHAEAGTDGHLGTEGAQQAAPSSVDASVSDPQAAEPEPEIPLPEAAAENAEPRK